MKKIQELELLDHATLSSTAISPHTVRSSMQSLSVLVIEHREDQRVQDNVRSIAQMLQTMGANFEIIIVHIDKKQFKHEKFKIEPLLQPHFVKVSSATFEISLNVALQIVQKDVVCIVDARMLFDVAELSKLFPAIEQHDIVLGYDQRQGPRKRLMGGGIWNSLVCFILGIKVRDISNVYRLYRAECLPHLQLETHGLMIHAEMFYKCICEGFTYTEVSISHCTRRPDTPIAMIRALWELFVYAQRWYLEKVKSSLR